MLNCLWFYFSGWYYFPVELSHYTPRRLSFLFIFFSSLSSNHNFTNEQCIVLGCLRSNYRHAIDYFFVLSHFHLFIWSHGKRSIIIVFFLTLCFFFSIFFFFFWYSQSTIFINHTCIHVQESLATSIVRHFSNVRYMLCCVFLSLVYCVFNVSRLPVWYLFVYVVFVLSFYSLHQFQAFPNRVAYAFRSFHSIWLWFFPMRFCLRCVMVLHYRSHYKLLWVYAFFTLFSLLLMCAQSASELCLA